MIQAFIAATLIAATYPPSRHFVYAFTIATDARPASADDQRSDTGSIQVDVVSFQSDTGTVVRVSEQSRTRASAQPSLCVAYGTGLVQCDAITNVTVEEMSLLRLLGRNFLNWGEIDNQRSWRNGAFDGRAREADDYRIVGQAHGQFDIAFERVLDVPGSDGFTSTTEGRLTYSEERSAPTSLRQETITKPQSGDRAPVVEDLTLTLRSDSLVGSRVQPELNRRTDELR